MATADLEIVVSARNEASKVLKDVDRDAGGLGKTLGDVSKIAGAFIAANAVAAGAQALTGFLGGSISAASDLGESLNAVDKIFGDSSGQILEWGESNATAFGLSQRAFNQMAVPLGASLRNTGLDMDTVATHTISLTERAADMASVFNTDVEEALTAIQAGLRGEADPLERFGVGLSAAKVEAHALAMTGKEVASSLTEQEKALARVDLIMLQTASAQGDFVQTSGEVANAARVQAAEQEELQAQIGEHLLPLQLKWTEAKAAFVELLATKVIPVVAEFAREHLPAVRAAINDVVAFVQTNWPIFAAIFTAVFNDVKARVEGFIQSVQGIVQIIQGVVATVDAIFKGDWSAAWTNMKLVAEGVMNLLIGTIQQMFGSIPGIIAGLAGEGYTAAKEFATGIQNGIVDTLNNLLRRAREIVQSIIDEIKSIPSQIPGAGLVGGAAGLLGFDSGGTVPGPRGAPQLAVVHGGETILPTHRGGSSLGSGGISVQFLGPVSFGGDRAGAESTVEAMAYSLTRALRARGMAV